jgi:hypothetical protein
VAVAMHFSIFLSKHSPFHVRLFFVIKGFTVTQARLLSTKKEEMLTFSPQINM